LIIFDKCEAAAQKRFTTKRVSAHDYLSFLGKNRKKIKAEIDAVSV
jgi:hypothetical protein